MKFQQILVSIGLLGGLAASEPVYKEIAHSIGYDYIQAANAGAAVGDGIRGLVNALGSLDEFKPIIYPGIVSSLNTLESFGGIIASLVGWAVKLAVQYIYTSDLLNDTPYIGELIRQADSMIEPEYKEAFSSLDSKIMAAQTTGQYH
ncbi:hypothetical protein IWW50_005453 [Coemansia erecta]|nr:hypothetical protein GGF43_004966 [Coemansia sp. RSA 2618]KAJ2819446.1 hypothetical protein IWW50_005453 [Coemansia erecta]